MKTAYRQLPSSRSASAEVVKRWLVDLQPFMSSGQHHPWQPLRGLGVAGEGRWRPFEPQELRLEIADF